MNPRARLFCTGQSPHANLAAGCQRSLGQLISAFGIRPNARISRKTAEKCHRDIQKVEASRVIAKASSV